jgi:lactoylglutathione lyase
MLRIKDPKVSLPFYQNHFGFQLIHDEHFPEWKFSVYYLGIPREGEVYPESGTPESERYLWTMKDVCLKLTHNHGSEDNENFRVHNVTVDIALTTGV